MQASRLWQISITASGATEAVATAALEHVTGAPVASYTDVRTGQTVVSVYLPEPPPRPASALVKAVRAELRARGVRAVLPVTCRRLYPRDWVEAWKRHFRPLVFGRALLIKPGWSRRRARPGQRVLLLNPGLSFGTGQHPTTRYCLREGIRLVRQAGRRRPRSVLDLGTGSGILALAAAKLGCAPVHALDADPIAVRVARANARANALAERVWIRQADLCHMPAKLRRHYALVFANLQADVLVAAARVIAERVGPGGHLVVAGVLDREFAAVRASYEQQGLRLRASKRNAEWRSGTFVRPVGERSPHPND